MSNANLFFHVHSDSISTTHSSPVKQCRKLLRGQDLPASPLIRALPSNLREKLRHAPLEETVVAVVAEGR